MRRIARQVHLLLRGRPSAVLRPGAGRRWAVLGFLFAAVYGAAMGSFAAWHDARRGTAPPAGGSDLARIALSAAKVPLLGGVAFAVTVPTFLVLGTLAGVRADARRAVRAGLAASAGAAVTLASLAPFTLLFYAGCDRYEWAVAWNGLPFAIAAAVGGVCVARCYAPLVRADPRHKWPLAAWAVLYAFTAVQLAWTLRPFVGNPADPVQAFRPHAWGNAYVVVFDLVVRLFAR